MSSDGRAYIGANIGLAVYIEESGTCITCATDPFWEYPNTDSSETEVCTHNISVSSDKTKVDTCKGKDVTNCTSTAYCSMYTFIQAGVPSDFVSQPGFELH